MVVRFPLWVTSDLSQYLSTPLSMLSSMLSMYNSKAFRHTKSFYFVISVIAAITTIITTITIM